MWQALRAELHGDGFEVVTVGLDTAGAEACRPFIEAAAPEHPSLIDTDHRVAEALGVINIPNGVWIDEQGMIVRPPEVAPAPPSLSDPEARRARFDPSQLPARMAATLGEAAGIVTDPAAYEAAIRDWVANGADSAFALAPDQVIARSRPRSVDTSRGQAHFKLAVHLEQVGDHEGAIEHFRIAHELVPDNFAYRRQAWSLEPGPDGPLARFWQGPLDGAEADWPYAGDWLTDVQAMGAANYYPRFEP